MQKELFRDFQQKTQVSKEHINKYKNLLPAELLDVWKNYGFGSIMNGYFRIINPEEYQGLVEDTYFRGNIAIPIFTTAFGDVVVWEENHYVRMIEYKNHNFQGMSAGFEFFWGDLKEGVFNEDFFDLNLYERAAEKYGVPEFDECFGFVPLLSMGGKKNIGNLKFVKNKEYIEFIVQMHGGIGK